MGDKIGLGVYIHYWFVTLVIDLDGFQDILGMRGLKERCFYL